MKTYLIFPLITLFSSTCLAITCPPMPEAVTMISKDVKVNIQGGIGTLGKVKAADVGLKAEVISKNLQEKFPNVDKLLIMQTMSATYCKMLQDAGSLSEKEKIQRWEKFQDKAMNLQEPVSPPKHSSIDSEKSISSTLLVAQNPSGITVERVALFPVLGESTVSLWAVLKNKYPLDALNIRVKYKKDEASNVDWAEKNRYMSSEMPSASILGPILKIPHDGEIVLRVIGSEEIIKFSPKPIDQWCLYDVHLVAYDSAISGYGKINPDFQESNIRSSSHTQSVSILFDLSFEDTFNNKHEMPVAAFFRFAEVDSTYVFYPSTGKYDSLQCLNA